MKRVKECVVENCIPTPTSCSTWNGGEISYLGICNGDPLNNIIWEIVGKLEDLAGEDLSLFDLDGLITLCNIKAPKEVTLLSILTVLRDNQICLKDYINTLEETLAQISKDSGVDINLKCFAQIDNIGNSLSITRSQLDQLIIDKLCDYKDKFISLEGAIVQIREEINAQADAPVEEATLSTCIDAGVKAASSQIKSVADVVCEQRGATGDVTAISEALTMIPSNWNTKYGTETGWISSPANMAQLINNILIVMGKQGSDITDIKTNCCAITCDDILIGFTASFSETNTIILRFTSGAGTNIPNGFTDKGSTITITDSDGMKQKFAIVISVGAEIEIDIDGMNFTNGATLNVNAKLGSESLTCEKCIAKTITATDVCAGCAVENVGSGPVTVTYSTVDAHGGSTSTTTTTTAATTSTTTTTTIAA